MTYDVERLFICIFSICISSLVKCLSDLLPIFKLGCLFSYCWVLRVLPIYRIQVLYQISVQQISFLPASTLSSHSLNSVFYRADIFNFKEVQFINFFSWIVLLVLYIRSHCQTLGHLDFLLLHILKSFIVLSFTFQSMIHFELIFVKGVKSLPRFIFCFNIRTFSCFRNIYWKNYPSSTELPLLLCQRSVDYICVGVFLGSLLCSIDLFV